MAFWENVRGEIDKLYVRFVSWSVSLTPSKSKMWQTHTHKGRQYPRGVIPRDKSRLGYQNSKTTAGYGELFVTDTVNSDQILPFSRTAPLGWDIIIRNTLPPFHSQPVIFDLAKLNQMTFKRDSVS